MAQAITFSKAQRAGAARLGASRLGASRLGATPTPMLDARLLLMAAAGIDVGALIAQSHAPVSAQCLDRFEAMIARRMRAEPVAYILGHRDFWRQRYRVTRDVLIPRADSECLIEAIIALRPPARGGVRSIVDLGTGSGCLLGALLGEYSEARGIGVDRSHAAAKVAAGNMAALGFSARARIVQGDWLGAIAGPVDVIVTNPPYIPAHQYRDLSADIRDFEPVCALVSGADGEADYRQILDQARGCIGANGLVVLEIGDGHARALEQLAADAFPDGVISMHRDLNSCPRALSINLDG